MKTLIIVPLLVLIVAIFAIQYPSGDLPGLGVDEAKAALPEKLFERYVGDGKLTPTSPKTWYRLFGPDKAANKIVFIHGISTPSICFVDLIEQIQKNLGKNAKKYQFLIFDSYGRGFSGAADVNATPDLHSKQLSELLAHIGWNKRVTVVGYSLGGSVGSSFAVNNPEIVKKLLLLAPAGAELIFPWYVTLRNKLVVLPMIGETISRVIIRPLMSKEFASVIPDENVRSLTDLGIFNSEAYSRSIYHILRNLYVIYTGKYMEENVMSKLGNAIFGRKGNEKLKIMAVWGSADQVVLSSTSETWQKYIPHAEIVTMEGEDHVFVNECPDKLAELVTPFLK